MPGPAKGQAEQQFTQARVQNCLYLVYIYVDYFDRYKRLYLFIYVHIIMQICTDINVYIRLYIHVDINEICVCPYLVYIIDQICTDISVYICSYTCI